MDVWALAAFVMFMVAILSRKLTSREKKSLRSPPGSDGWLFVGETLQFYLSSPTEFVRRRVQKFGNVFYTNILRSRLIVVHDNDLMKVVLDDPHQIFVSSLPANVARLNGPGSIPNVDGAVHRKMTTILVEASSPKHHQAWLEIFSDIIQKTVESWREKRVNCSQDGQKMFVKLGLAYIFGVLEEDEDLMRRIVENLEYFSKSLTAFPVNLPGTQFYRGLQGKKKLGSIVVELSQRYLKLKEIGENPPVYSMLEYFMEYNKDSAGLSVEELPDLMINSIHAQFEFLPFLFDWIVMYLTENYDVLQKVKEENVAIKDLKGGDSYILDIEDLSKMRYSAQVFQETLRLATIVNVTTRKCTKSIEYNGYTIPANWDYAAIIRSLHYNPENFPNPEKFDPSRFEGDGKNLKPNSYMPFGKGRRFCKGAKVTRIQILAIIHYLSTRLSPENVEVQTTESAQELVATK